jgi:hypothetical protein
MPIHSQPLQVDDNGEARIFHIVENYEVYDGSLALAIDHLLNHIKVLVTTAYLSEGDTIHLAKQRHPLLRNDSTDQRSHDRILLADCIRLLDAVVEIAHLAAYPETIYHAAAELNELQKHIPFLDYRYDNDPYPSDSTRED